MRWILVTRERCGDNRRDGNQMLWAPRGRFIMLRVRLRVDCFDAREQTVSMFPLCFRRYDLLGRLRNNCKLRMSQNTGERKRSDETILCAKSDLFII